MPEGLDLQWVDKTIANPPDEPPVLVEGLLRPGELLVLGAPRGVGKSWWIYNLAVQLANGTGLFLGTLPVRRQGRTLILQGELDPWALVEPTSGDPLRCCRGVRPHRASRAGVRSAKRFRRQAGRAGPRRSSRGSWTSASSRRSLLMGSICSYSTPGPSSIQATRTATIKPRLACHSFALWR